MDEAAKSFSDEAMTDCRQPITRERKGKELPITEKATTNAHATNQQDGNIKALRSLDKIRPTQNLYMDKNCRI